MVAQVQLILGTLKTILKPKLWGDIQDQGMRSVVDLNTLDMHSTAILRPPSCPFSAFPFSITKLNLQTAHTFISKYQYL